MRTIYFVFRGTLYHIRWWAFVSRWMIVRRHRFGTGWILYLGPLEIARYLQMQPTP